MNDNYDDWSLFWVVVACIGVAVLALVLFGGFVWFYFWAVCKLVIAVVSALASGIATVVHAAKT